MSEPTLVDPKWSDVSRECAAIATSCFHFAELVMAAGRDGSSLNTAERTIIGDIANSVKHGKRNDAAKEVTLTAWAVFEFNDQNMFNFLRIEVAGSYPNGHPHDVYPLLANYANRCIDLLGLSLSHVSPDVVAPPNWCAEVRLWETEKTVFANQVRYKLLKRDANGTLIPAWPADFKFVVYEKNTESPQT